MEYRAGMAYTGIMRGNNLAVSRIDYYRPAGQRVWVRVGNGDYSSFATKLAFMSEQRKYSTDNPFRSELWHSVEGFEDLTDITYHRLNGEGRKNGIVRIAFDRPEVRNAFRPHTVDSSAVASSWACSVA